MSDQSHVNLPVRYVRRFAESQVRRFADCHIFEVVQSANLRICECKTLQICESTNLHEIQSSFIFQTPMTERLCHTHNESAHAHMQGVRTQPLRGSNTSTRYVTLLFPAMDADSIHFTQAKEATEQWCSASFTSMYALALCHRVPSILRIFPSASCLYGI